MEDTNICIPYEKPLGFIGLVGKWYSRDSFVSYRTPRSFLSVSLPPLSNKGKTIHKVDILCVPEAFSHTVSGPCVDNCLARLLFTSGINSGSTSVQLN